MRNLLSATHARDRAVRACLNVLTGSFITIGLTACGGGGDAATDKETAEAQALSDTTRAQAVATSSVPATGLIKGDGWTAQLPTMPILASETPAYTATGFTRAFYVSASGNDQLDGTTPGTAWKTLGRAVGKTDYAAGDAILLKCGDVWQDREMALSGSGNPSIKNGVLLAAYGCDGSKKRPVISGANALPVAQGAAWQVSANNGAVRTIGLGASVKRLFLDGVPQMPARYPNEQGGKRFTTATPLPPADTETDEQKKTRLHRFFQINAADLSALAQKDLTNATVYIRTNPYTIETAVIKAFNGTTGVVELSSDLAFPIMKNTGYFLEGKTWMVDQPGEWAQDSSNVLHYATTAPDTTRLTAMVRRLTAGGAPKKTYGLWFNQVDNMRIEHLRFEYTDAGIDLSESKNVVVRGIESHHAFEDGIVAGNSNGIQVHDSLFSNSGRNGVRIMVSNDARVAGNVVRGTGMFFSGQPVGADVVTGVGFTGWAIRVDGTNSVVENNLVENTANVGIMFSNKTGTQVRNNTVVRPCLMLTDCGGIYTHGDKLVEMKAVTPATSQVYGNLVAGLTSNLDGSFLYGTRDLIAGQNQANGIYIDSYSANIEVFNNFVSGAEVGFYLHNSSYNIIRNNEMQGISYAALHVSSDEENNNWAIRGNQFLNNKLFSRRTVDQAAFNNVPYKGVRGDMTYAQLWQHSKLDATTFFADKVAGVVDRNVSSGNVTVSLSKSRQPEQWRAESPDRVGNAPMVMEQVTGAVWGLRSGNEPFKPLGRGEWLALTSASATTPDSEESPMGFKPYRMTYGSPLLNNSFGSSTVWTTQAGVLTRLASGTPGCPTTSVGCGKFYATGLDDRLMSGAFTLSAGVLYQTGYSMSASSASSARHSSHLRTSASPSIERDTVSAPMELKAGESRRVQTFVRPAEGLYGSLALRASDNTATWRNKNLYFAGVSVVPVTSVAVLPPMSSIVVSAVNASNEARTFTCADLGVTAGNCSLIRDAQAGTPTSLSVPARSAARFYVALTDWPE